MQDATTSNILLASDLGRRFHRRKGLLHHEPFFAVRAMDLAVEPGTIVAVIGESGCGKTTLARMLVGMLRSSEGRVRIRMGDQWRDVSSLDAAQEAAFRRCVQMVYQESDLALDPMLPVLQSVQEGYQVNWPDLPRQEARRSSIRLLHELGLRPRQWRSLPGILSGGERKRAVIARAFAAIGYGLGQPPDSLPGRVIIADEPTAGLDCATQALLLSFFRKQQAEMGLAFVLISHDLAMVRAFSDRVVVMFGGRTVERGLSESIWPDDGTANFMHPYSCELASEATPEGDFAEHPVPPAAGCVFRAECPFAEPACEEPQPWQGTPDHQWACQKAEAIAKDRKR
jgi:ABC-type glutathione transport system ATPase component